MSVSNIFSSEQIEALVFNSLNGLLYLNETERKAKRDIQGLLEEFEQKFERLFEEKAHFEYFNDKHFCEIRRKMDFHWEVLNSYGEKRQHIREEYLNLIDKTKEVEKRFNKCLDELDILKIDFQEQRV